MTLEEIILKKEQPASSLYGVAGSTALCGKRVELGDHPGSGGQNDFATPSGGCQWSATRLRMKVHGELTEHGEVVPHPKVVDEGDELARRFTIRASARDALERHAASEGHTRVLPNTCEESRQMKGIAWYV